jgi:hypothetical protein
LITEAAWVILCSAASLSFGNVSFIAYPQDHAPRHVHGFSGEVEVIVNLNADGTITLANRHDAMRPRNAKRSDMRKILDAAGEHFEELVRLWEKMHVPSTK